MITVPTPLFLFSKPTPGTGASLLVDVLLWPVLGADTPRLTASPSEDEMRRTLTAKLDTAPIALFLDNLKSRETRARDGSETLDSEALSAAITSTQWEDRRIKHTALVSVPVTNLWLASGNNPQLSREIKRRVVRVHLDARCERPDHRTGFKHPDLRHSVTTHRTDLVVAALTLTQAWIAEGMPAGPRTLGMFESWAQTLGGILEIGDIPGFLDDVSGGSHGSDDDTDCWRTFTAAWWQAQNNRAATAGELVSLADGVLDLGSGDRDSQTKKLGHQLAAKRDRVFAALQIRAAGSRQNARLWRLDQVGTHTTHRKLTDASS